MLRVLIGRGALRASTNLSTLWAVRSFHPSAVSCERRHAHAGKKKRNKRSKATSKNSRENRESRNARLPQEKGSSQASAAFESLTKMTSEPLDNFTSLPLDRWSKSKADATFFHGKEGLACQWSSASIQTSQHPSVQAVLQNTTTQSNEEEVDEVDEEDTVADEVGN